MGKEDASFEEVEEVCKIAEAHDFILSFSDGYDTYLGQGGVNLSGGAKTEDFHSKSTYKKT